MKETIIQRILNANSCDTSIREIPKDCKGVHESVLKSWQAIRLVSEMIKRWDSLETISDTIEFLGY